MSPTVVLLHGLGGNTWTLEPLRLYLKYYCQNPKIVVFNYKTDYETIRHVVEGVAAKLTHLVTAHEPLVVIGHSLGGIVALRLHRYFNVLHAIAVASPISKPILLSFSPLLNFRLLYKDLSVKPKEFIPPHSYLTVSASWPCAPFDGILYNNESILEPKCAKCIPWTDHRLVIVDPRLFTMIKNELNKMIIKDLIMTSVK